MDIIKRVEELMFPICEQTGTYLVDVEYEQERGDWFLRISIDTESGLTMEECVIVTELIGAKLDEDDFIVEEYMMEVSSPGAERPLKTAEAIDDAIGYHVNILVKKAIDEVKEFQGDLLSFDGEVLVVECLFKTRRKKVEIEYSNVKKARLAVKY